MADMHFVRAEGIVAEFLVLHLDVLRFSKAWRLEPGMIVRV
jgi:hypothetical protein